MLVATNKGFAQMNNLLIKKSVACIALLLSACNSKQVVDDAQCSDSEQGMFLTCISSGCSASYTQNLSGTDICSVEGSGTIVSVEAGGECGFTSSGSCYVICDCPDGIGVTFEVANDTESDEIDSFEGDTSGECSDGADNDRDGKFDCYDDDCANSPDCLNIPDTGYIEDNGSIINPEDTGLTDTGLTDTGLADTIIYDEDGDGFSVYEGDCDDKIPSINPVSTDIVGDTIDQNCDGIDGTDIDHDGFASQSSGGNDCNDFDAVINTDFGIFDTRDYIDSNCDGVDGLSFDYKSVHIQDMGALMDGDFDGDGLSDLVAWSIPDGDYYIFLGSTINLAGSEVLTYLDADIAMHLVSTYPYPSFQIKDIDGDGLDDLGFNLGDNAYIFYGRTISVSSNLIPGSNHDFYIYPGESTRTCSSPSYLPTSISVTFHDDLNGDGLSDITFSSTWPNSYQYLASYSDIASGGGSTCPSYGTNVWGRYPGMRLGGLDTDSDGKPEFIKTCYGSHYSDIYTGYGDIDGSCVRLSIFVPIMVLPDIDGDGDVEISNYTCAQNVSNFSDSSYCDYRSSDGYFEPSRFINLDGNNSKEFVRPSGGDTQSIILDYVLGGPNIIEFPSNSILTEAIGDYDGDGLDDLISNCIYIIGIR